MREADADVVDAPGLQSIVHDLVYLDHASTSWPKPASMIEGIRGALALPLGNPARGAHAAADRAGGLRTRLRRRLAELLGVGDERRVILTAGCTDGANILLSGFPWEADPGVDGTRIHAPASIRPRVVASMLEHNAVARPLEALASVGRIELVRLAPDTDGIITPRALLAAIDTRTRLVAVTSASNVTGVPQPLPALAAALRTLGPDRPMLLTDAAQIAGLIPADVDRTGIDMFIFSAHKALLGPTGVGALALSPRAAAILKPTRFGGTGTDAAPLTASPPGSAMPADGSHLPASLEPGTPNTLAHAGWLAVLEDRSLPPPEDRWAAESALAADLATRLSQIPGLVLLVGVREGGIAAASGSASSDRATPTDPPRRLPIVTFLPPASCGLGPAEFASALDAGFGVAARAGLHCAPWAHEHLGTLPAGGAVRLSVGWGNTAADVRRAADAVAALVRV